MKFAEHRHSATAKAMRHVILALTLFTCVFSTNIQEAIDQCKVGSTFTLDRWVCDPTGALSSAVAIEASANLAKVQATRCPCDNGCKRPQVISNTAGIKQVEEKVAFVAVLIVVDEWNTATLERDANEAYNRLHLNGTRRQLENDTVPCDNGVLLIYNSAKGDIYSLRGLQTKYRLTDDELTVIQTSAANTFYGDNSSEAHNQRMLKLTESVRDQLVNEPIDPHALGGYIAWALACAIGLTMFVLIVVVCCSLCCKTKREKHVDVLKRSIKDDKSVRGELPPQNIYALPSNTSPAFGSATTEPIYVISEPSSSEENQSTMPHVPEFHLAPPFVDPLRPTEWQSKKMAVY